MSIEKTKVWIIAVNVQGGHHLPTVRIVDPSKLPDEYREAYLKNNEGCEEKIFNQLYGKKLSSIEDPDETIRDKCWDEFYETLHKAIVPLNENLQVEKILTYSEI